MYHHQFFQASHENVVHQLRDKLGKSKEEMELLMDEIKLCEEAVLVKREEALEIEAGSGPLSGSSRKSAGRSLSDEVLYMIYMHADVVYDIHACRIRKMVHCLHACIQQEMLTYTL